MEIVKYRVSTFKTIAFAIAILTQISCSAQQDIIPDMSASFAAVIVSDIDTSIAWYTQILGFEVVDRKEYPDMGLKQSNLQNGPVSIELIELGSAIDLQSALPNFTKKTKVIGIFKIGFTISDFENTVKRLQDSGVAFNGSVVQDSRTGKSMVIILDPDGNRIQLFER